MAMVMNVSLYSQNFIESQCAYSLDISVADTSGISEAWRHVLNYTQLYGAANNLILVHRPDFHFIANRWYVLYHDSDNDAFVDARK